MNRTDIEARIRATGNWFHNLNLCGVMTNPKMGDYPESRWRLLEPFIPQDLTGKTVLDLACNSGYFSIKMKERGAKHVLGIDAHIEQAKLVTELYGAEIELRAQNVYEFILTNTTQFDYVLFLGLFYHLRHPLLVLDRVAELTREKMLFQTELYPPPSGAPPFVPKDNYSLSEASVVFDSPDFPRMAFVEKSVNDDRTNWWFPNEACVFSVLRSAGFSKITRTVSPTGDHCYICEPSTLLPRDDFYFWLSRCPTFPAF